MDLVSSKLGRVFFVRLLEGEDLLDAVNLVAKNSRVKAGFFFLIGTLKKTNVGFYREGKYETIRVKGPLEIVSCVGNVSLKDNKPFAHAHVAVSNEKGEVLGGHVMPGCIIAASGELVMVEATDVRLVRKMDDKTKLFLWSFGK